ncbi:MAG: hypothetical protein LBR58_01350 [Propionibacteriaceae bacterium]|jgi:hypothetical protein|nr:hypothetical protein [Propionibacteriaceae bacterium]
MKNHLLTSGLIALLLALTACTGATVPVNDDVSDDTTAMSDGEDAPAGMIYYDLNDMIEEGTKSITTAHVETIIEKKGTTEVTTGVVDYTDQDNPEFDIVKEGVVSSSERIIQADGYMYASYGNATPAQLSGSDLNPLMYDVDLSRAAHDAIYGMVDPLDGVQPTVTFVGEEQLDGQAVQHYNVTGKQVYKKDEPQAVLDIWFNASGQPIKFVFQEQDATTTCAYTQLGEPVTIEAPADFYA